MIIDFKTRERLDAPHKPRVDILTLPGSDMALVDAVVPLSAVPDLLALIGVQHADT